MAVIEKDLGPVSAYAVAVAHGYTGTEAEWEALIANSAINAQSAGASATAAAASAQEAAQQKTQAQAQAMAAQAHATQASNFANTAGQANSYAQMARSNAAVSAANASNAQTAAEAAQAAAEAAVTGAEAAQTAAEAAVTDAQTAKTAAETAAATAAAAYGTDLLADDYSTSKTYAVGDYVIYSGNLYRCTTAITTAEAWTAAHWTQAQIGPDVSDLKSAFVDQQEGKLPYFIVKNEYINASNGAFQGYNGWDRTELIPVFEYTSIKVKSSASSGYNAFYKTDKSFYSTFNVGTAESTINIPWQAAYVAFSNSAAGMAALEASYIKKIDNAVTDVDKATADASVGNLPLALTRNESVSTNDGSFVVGIGYTRTGHVYVGNAQQIIISAGASSAYNCYYDANKDRIDSFSVSAGENIINIADNVQYIALANVTDSMLQTTVRISKYRTPDYEYENGYNAYVYNDIPETEYSYDNGLTYSVKNGVITLDGALTSATFRQDFPLVTLNGYYIFNIEVLSGSYTGNLYILKLPHSSGQNAYINGENGALTGHVNRLDYFANEQHGFAVYASNGATFTNLKFRIWLVSGLLDKPFDLPGYTIQHSLATGCDVGEYNTPDYTHIGDGVTYSTFGNALAVCKDGMIGKNASSDTVKFGLLADLHYTDHENFYKRIYTKLSDENIDFCMMAGDIIDSGYFSTVALHHAQMTQYKNSIQYLRCPNFPFAGNHDDDVAEFAHHGVVDYGNVRLIYFWADYDGTSEAGLVKSEELTWLGNQLAQSKAKYNILMCHYAVSTDTGFGWYIADSTTRDAIKTLASTYGVKLYLNGHEHDHNITVGDAGVMKDINLPNGQYAYGVCTISGTTFTAVFYDATTDATLKTVTVDLS